MKTKDNPVYQVWLTMRRRCDSPNVPSYHLYGGRGIKVCSRWEKFTNFAEDMGERPLGAQIERIDNNGDYEPNNCRWASRKEQCRNRKTNKIITINGVSKCLADWVHESPVSKNTILSRIYNLQWDVEKAIFAPPVALSAKRGERGKKKWRSNSKKIIASSSNAS